MRCLFVDHLTFQSRPAWRAAGVSLLFALAAVALPDGADATTAADICASTEDPCRVTTTIAVDPESVIDVERAASRSSITAPSAWPAEP